MTPGPDFRDVIGDDVPEEERERLHRVHEALVAAGPPPELPPALARPPAAPGTARLFPLPRRRVGATLVLAAALALVLFGAGYLAGHRNTGFRVSLTVPMHGTAAAPQALASIRVGDQDRSGNWPLDVRVRGLRELPKGGYYELFLTKGHRPAVSCGTFTVHAGVTRVRLNAPYELKRFDGWVVTAHLPGRPELGSTLLST